MMINKKSEWEKTLEQAQVDFVQQEPQDMKQQMRRLIANASPTTGTAGTVTTTVGTTAIGIAGGLVGGIGTYVTPMQGALNAAPQSSGELLGGFAVEKVKNGYLVKFTPPGHYRLDLYIVQNAEDIGPMITSLLVQQRLDK